MSLKALALNCTLKADGSEESSTDAMIAVLAEAFSQYDVTAVSYTHLTLPTI